MHSNLPGEQDQPTERFESDTQKLVKLHLQDPNHTISEDEIRNVRIGMTPVLYDDENPVLEDKLEEIAEEESGN